MAPRSSPNGRRIAAIDIGSNSIRQIVADVSAEGTITVVDEMKAAPRLGADVDVTGVLGGQAMKVAAEAIGRMATLARQLGAERIEAVATSAVRDAANRDEFIARVRQEAGLSLRVIDGSGEARLSYLSALAHFDLGVGRTVVMDIGGGSLELALSADGVLDDLVSLPFGALRLTERYLRDGTGTRKALRQLRKEVRARLRDVLPRGNWRGAQIIGSGGTFTNLAGIHLARRGMLSARTVHETAVPRVEVEHILDALAAMTAEERRALPGLNRRRRRHHRGGPRGGRRGDGAARVARAGDLAVRHPRGAAAGGGARRPHGRGPRRSARAFGARARRAVPL
jgi:Exopolyphosphatase